MHSWRHVLLLSSAVIFIRPAPVKSPNLVDLFSDMTNIPLADMFFMEAVGSTNLYHKGDAESALRLLEPDLQIKIKKWQEKYNGLPGTAKDFAYVVSNYFYVEAMYLFKSTTDWSSIKARFGNMSRSDCSALYKTFPVLSSTGLCTP